MVAHPNGHIEDVEESQEIRRYDEVKTVIEELDEMIEKEKDARNRVELKKRRVRLLQAQANEPTGNRAEDDLWRRQLQSKAKARLN